MPFHKDRNLHTPIKMILLLSSCMRLQILLCLALPLQGSLNFLVAGIVQLILGGWVGKEWLSSLKKFVIKTPEFAASGNLTLFRVALQWLKAILWKVADMLVLSRERHQRFLITCRLTVIADWRWPCGTGIRHIAFSNSWACRNKSRKLKIQLLRSPCLGVLSPTPHEPTACSLFLLQIAGMTQNFPTTVAFIYPSS